MVDFSKREDVKRWLDAIEPAERRREVAIVIAARAALRVTPTLARALPKAGAERDKSLSALVLPVLRAASIPWAATKDPAARIDIRYAAASAAAAADAANRIMEDKRAARAAYASARAAYASNTANTAFDFAVRFAVAAYAASALAAAPDAIIVSDEQTDATFSDAFAIAAAEEAAFGSFSADAGRISAGQPAAHLASAPLWLEGTPNWADDLWLKLKSAMLSSNSDWRVWTDWYEDRLLGAPADESLEVTRALIDDRIWKEGPRAVNAEIARLIAEHVPNDRSTAEESERVFDSFISYATKDEAIAREVAEVLDSAGYVTFAQFKDFGVGRNFVELVNSGLHRSARMVALYSPHYKSSPHCRAEWATFYNLDPDGKRRKLIPLLISPTELDPLARQVIYKSLVGLDRSRRKAAILEAVVGVAPISDAETIKKTLAEVASPEAKINERQQIDAGPNAIGDRPFVDKDLPELPSRQRGLADTIRKSLPRNAPEVVRHCLQSYSDHLLAMGTQPVMGYLGDLAEALYAECDSPEASDWKNPGVAKLFERLFANHEMLRTHFPLKHDEVIAQFPIDEDLANGNALRDPFKVVEAAIKDLQKADKATPAIVTAVSSNAAFANDLATLPRSKKGERRPLITVKQRYVLGSIGFLVTIYNLIGTTASIYGVPEGAALMRAVSEAIEKFMAFLL